MLIMNYMASIYHVTHVTCDAEDSQWVSQTNVSIL